MNFVEQELSKIVEPQYPGSTYVGGRCYVMLGSTTRARLGIYGDNLSIAILDSHFGEIDKITLDFSDMWEEWKRSPSVIHPRLQQNHWESYQPNADDYQALSNAVGKYLEVFREPEQDFSQQWGPSMG